MKPSRIDSTFLKSKIARRIFFLFIGCALLPIVVLTVLTFFHVATQIKTQSLDRLQQSSKTYGVSIYERFLALESDMLFVASTRLNNDNDKFDPTAFGKPFQIRIQERFSSLHLIKDGESPQLLFGSDSLNANIIEDFSAEDEKNQILLKKQNDRPVEVYIVIPIEKNKSQKSFLLARINNIFLWGLGHENILPPMTELCVLGQAREVIVGSFQTNPELLQKIASREGGQDARQFEYKDSDREEFLVSFWPLYLKGNFQAPNLTIILRQSKRDVLAPMENFKTIFPLAVLLSLWIALLLSMVFIRRYMVPVEKLKEATVHIAQRDFSRKIDIKSGDEFETLAQSFNTMSSRLNKQFNALETISDISQTILSSLNTPQIIQTALMRLSQFFESDTSQIILFKDPKSQLAFAYNYSADQRIENVEGSIEITKTDTTQLQKQQYIIRTDEEALPTYLTDFPESCMKMFLQFPLLHNKELKGMINLGFKEQSPLAEEDRDHARQLADQITIALSNADLIETLEKFNWGTLEALARTVDAKSHWTAGHSERVTDLTIKISRIMGFSNKETTILHQAALVHDIGKIGIPSIILDKPGKLTDEEYHFIKQHPVIGARILEPITAFADVLNIVLHHHEQYNGSGYPEGLKGEEIGIGARILAIADVYDALISARPYRAGWVKDKVVELIQKESGSMFDPEVVKAFLRAVQ